MATVDGGVEPMRVSESLDALELNDDDARALREAFAAIEPGHGLRAVWLTPIAEQVEAELADAPDTLQRYRQLVAAHAPRSRFAYMPLASLVMCMAGGASLVPDTTGRSLVERTNELLRRSGPRAMQSPILRPVLVACGESLHAFTEATSRNHDLFHNYGRMRFERLDARGYEVHYDDHYPGAERYYLEGFYAGILGHFGILVPPRFVQRGPRSFSIVVRP